MPPYFPFQVFFQRAQPNNNTIIQYVAINFFIGFQPSVTYCIVLYWVVLFEKKLKRENKEAQCFRKQTVGFSEKGQ